jgi:hypothetical protein
LALSAVLIAVSAAGRIGQARERQARQSRLDALSGEADAQERAGMPGLALAEIEAALKLARAGDGDPSAQLPKLAQRRDDLARREIGQFLEKPPSTTGDYDVGVWEGLALRATRDPALVALIGDVLARRDEAKARWANAELAEARRLAGEGNPTRSLALADHAARLANGLSGTDAAALQRESETLVEGLVREFGLVIGPIHGDFHLGTSVAYDILLMADLAGSMADRGYLPKPAPKATGARWAALWPRLAPYRASILIRERYLGTYLQSQNRMSRVSAEVTLQRGGDRVWIERAEAQTSEPLTAIPSYVASRMGTARRTSLDEHLLYEDARDQLVAECRRKMGNLPKASRTSIR